MHHSFPPHPKNNKIRLSGEDTFRHVKKVGVHNNLFNDVYHRFLTMKWPLFFVLMASIYTLINALFGSLYALASTEINGVSPHHFWGYFFFSVHTLSTVGYGNITPTGDVANFIVTIETFIGIIFTGLITGLIFARFSRPHARVLFSKAATISLHHNTPILALRIGNLRPTALINLTVEAILVRSIPDRTNKPTLHLEKLTFQNDHLPLLPVSWTISHAITDKSPLYNFSKEILSQQKAEIVVTLSATDQVSAQTVFSMHTYDATTIHYDRTLCDIMHSRDDGSIVTDFSLFHATIPASHNTDAT